MLSSKILRAWKSDWLNIAIIFQVFCCHIISGICMQYGMTKLTIKCMKECICALVGERDRYGYHGAT